MITRKMSKSSENCGPEIVNTLKSIQSQIVSINTSLASVHSELTEIKDEIATIRDLHASLQYTQAELADVKDSVAILKTAVDSQNDEVASIKSQYDKISQANDILNEKILKVDTYNRRESLIFSGLLEDDGETYRDTNHKIRKFLSDQLHISNAEDMHFQRCHRLGKKFEQKSRDIIVKFAFFPDREEVWSKRFDLKGTQISMSEDYPPEIDQRRAKLYPIYKLAKQKKYKPKLIADKLVIKGKHYTVDSLDSLPSELKLKNLAESTTDGALLFYGNGSSFSHFSSATFTVNNVKYESSEQYFQHQKAIRSGNMDIAAQILQTKDAKESYLLGKKVTDNLQLWNDKISKEIMEIGLRAKFEQNPLL